MGIQILIACLSSTGLSTLIQFLIKRRDDKKGQLLLITKQLERLERDNCRTQMLILMNHYESNVQEIMKVAEHYFKDLDGDWYMTTLFNDYLEKNGIGKPEWFDAKK